MGCLCSAGAQPFVTQAKEHIWILWVPAQDNPSEIYILLEGEPAFRSDR